jgi:pyruvate kinase
LQRRTRIVATLGPATDRPGVLETLLQEGLDVARINFSHGSAAEHQHRITRLRVLAEPLSRPVAVLLDLPGPKLRVLLEAPIALAEGQQIALAMTPDAEAPIRVTEPTALVEQ